MTLQQLLKEWLSLFGTRNQQVTHIKVSRTKAQRRNRAFLIGGICLVGQFIIGFIATMTSYWNNSQVNWQVMNITAIILTIEVVLSILWIWLHSRFSPFEKWKIATLLKDFSEESDILRKHKSDIDSTQSIRWEYYLESGMTIVTLYQGGHVTKSRAEEIPQALLSYFVKETRDKWFLEQYHVGDGFVKIILSHQPDKALHIKGREDFKESEELNIRLTERLNWTTKQPMGLVVGPTSSGKSSLLKYLSLAFLINNKKNQIFTIDGKGAYLSQAMSIIGDVAVTGDEAFSMISTLEELMNQRYKDLTADVDSEEDLTHNEKFHKGQILLVIDEYLALVTTIQAEDKLRKPAERLYPQFYAKLMSLIVKGRQASIFVIVSGQMIPTSILPSEARDSLGLRIALGRISQSQATEIFNVSKNDLPSADSTLYEGVVFLDGLGLEHPIVFKTPYYNDRQLPFKGALRVLKSERCMHRSETQNN
ncbi:TPA: cell division protein FtsK [Streptococcus suis]